MAVITKESIRTLKRLCRINFSEEEEVELQDALEKILNYFEKLEEIDTEGVQPCSHILEEINNIMRDDETGDLLPREVFLANAPAHTGGMIRVPPIIKGKS